MHSNTILPSNNDWMNGRSQHEVQSIITAAHQQGVTPEVAAQQMDHEMIPKVGFITSLLRWLTLQ